MSIKFPKHCLQQEILLLYFLYVIVRLREDMIPNMEFMHTTSGMQNTLKTIILWKQTKKTPHENN